MVACIDFVSCVYCVFFFKQKTAYEMRISDWSSDVCSSDLPRLVRGLGGIGKGSMIAAALTSPCLIRSDGRTITIEPLRVVPFSHGVGVAGIPLQIGRASCRERVCQYV